METLLFYWLTILYSLSNSGSDPVQQTWNGRQESRQLDCERMSQAEAHERHPLDVPAAERRAGALQEVDALVCSRRLIRFGQREARDELILTKLTSDVSELTQQAAALGSPTTTWHVDAFYPQPQIGQKIAMAARANLMETGHTVTSRAPLLAGGDLAVLHNLSIEDALPLACQRFFAEGTLKGDDAFLGVALVRAQESQLHAGACIKGSWRWLR